MKWHRAAALALVVSAWAYAQELGPEADAGAAAAVPAEVSDGGAAEVAATAADAGEAMEIESFAPVASSPIENFEANANAGPQVRMYGFAEGLGMVDTRFDSPRGAELAENVYELRARAWLGAELKLSDWLKVVLEGRVQVRGAAQRNFDRAKGFFEPMLGEAYVDIYNRHVDVRIGNQRVGLGANRGLAAVDALNPRDLRLSFATTEPEDAMLPVFAVRARGEVGPLQWLVAYAPFFTPHRYFVFGQDEALVQPGAPASIQNTRLDPSIEDYVQERILETKRPVPFAGDVALRVVSTGALKVGASWVWLNEKLPQVRMDKELAALLSATVAGKSVDPAVATSVSNRLQAGEQLYRGEYQRQHVFGLEGSRLLGPGQLDVDVSFSPAQTFIDPGLTPLRKSTITWVVSYSQASESPLLYSISYVGMAVPGVGANEQLFLVEPATAVGAARTAWLHVFMGMVAYPVWRDRLELSLRAAFEPIQKSFALAPRVTFQAIERLKLYVAGEIYEGNPYSPFGYFSRNDKVVVGARVELF